MLPLRCACDTRRALAGRSRRDAEAQREQDRTRYREHYSGLEAYGETGLTRLEELIDAAVVARDAAPAARESGLRTGAAVLTRAGKIFSGCAVESVSSRGLSVSAERTVILNAVSHGHRQFDAILLASDHPLGCPLPPGEGRQFLSEWGDFPVYLLKHDQVNYARCTPLTAV